MSEKNFSFLNNITDDDRILLSKVVDWVDLSREKYTVKFSSFMDLSRVSLCKSVLDSLKYDNYMFWGGYEGAERQMLCVYSEYKEVAEADFPFEVLEFSFRKSDKLSHRDFLGSLMALQISRDCVGDILTGEGKAQVFITDSVIPLALENIRKIGKVGVKVSRECGELIKPKISFAQIEGVIASPRIDCVLSLCLKLSREKSGKLVKSGLVQVNHFVCESLKKQILQDDVVSVRGYGKFIIKNIGSMTKKGKLHITVYKYI